MNSKYNQLFQPFTFKNGITIKNRVVMAPMTTWASNDDLTISNEEVSFIRKRVNGVGLVIYRVYAGHSKWTRLYE